MKTLIFIFTFIMIISWEYLAEASCVTSLQLKPVRASKTENLTSYLHLLIDQRVLDVTDIARLDQALQNGELINPISLEQSATRSEALVHYAEIQKYIDSGEINRARLSQWSKELIGSRKQALLAREEVKENTASLYRKMEFLPVPQKKSSNMLNFIKRNVLRLRKMDAFPYQMSGPIEMTSTAVTQMQWAEVMGTNPSHFRFGPDQIKIDINGKEISMRPDHPVETITWWSAAAFCNTLSQKAGLKPVYDFKDVTFHQETSAKEGNLAIDVGTVKINAPEGNIYLAEGYRLPTRIEFLHAISYADKGSWGAFNYPVLLHAWLKENSGNHTHAVAQLPPIRIGEHKFYDLVGNVSEWQHEPLLGFLYNPHPQQDRLRATHGSDYLSPLTTIPFRTQGVNFYDRYVGFRLVRSLKK